MALAVAVPDPAPVVPRLHRANRVLDWRKDRTFLEGFGGKDRILGRIFVAWDWSAHRFLSVRSG